MAEALFAGRPQPPVRFRWVTVVLDALALAHTQRRIAPLGGVVGLDYAGVAAVLAPEGWPFWDQERGCIRRGVLHGLRICERLMIQHSAQQVRQGSRDEEEARAAEVLAEEIEGWESDGE